MQEMGKEDSKVINMLGKVVNVMLKKVTVLK